MQLGWLSGKEMLDERVGHISWKGWEMDVVAVVSKSCGLPGALVVQVQSMETRSGVFGCCCG